MIKFLYKNIIKPILFCFPADDIHSLFLKFGNFLGRVSFFRYFTKKIFFYENEILSQNVLGVSFRNPIGLAAGFDYDADLINILPSVGFGFHTIGTVTNLPYKGNPRPMLGRLPKSKSLLVNKGFKNSGVDFILNKVKNKSKKIPLGISIGSTNKPYNNTEEMVNDIVSSFKKVLKEDIFDYFELNISCPNLINSGLNNKLDTVEGLELLLSNLDNLSISKPLFIKMYSEKSVEETISLTSIAEKHAFVKGLIFSNLVKDRTNKYFNKDEIEKAGRGNFSGKPVEDLSNELISAVYQKYKDRFILIGVGGVFNGLDAYEKIKRGANLIQMITGMIYEGPSQIGEINKELVNLLKKDGFKNIKEAVGSNYTKKPG